MNGDCSFTTGNLGTRTVAPMFPISTSLPRSPPAPAPSKGNPIDLDKLHLATGRVSLASVVRMPITEFRVAPRRPDWAETLDRAEQVFQQETGPFA